MSGNYFRRHSSALTAVSVALSTLFLVVFFQNCEGSFQVDEERIKRDSTFSVPIVDIQTAIPALMKERSVSISLRTGQDPRLTLNEITCRLLREKNGIFDVVDDRDCSALSTTFSYLTDGNYRLEVEAVDSRNQRTDIAT